MVSNLAVGAMVILAIISFWLLITVFLLITVLKNKSHYTFPEVIATITILGIIFIISGPLILIFLSFL